MLKSPFSTLTQGYVLLFGTVVISVLIPFLPLVKDDSIPQPLNCETNALPLDHTAVELIDKISVFTFHKNSCYFLAELTYLGKVMDLFYSNLLQLYLDVPGKI